ncbi:MAG: substrate-binding domain-containing protein [Solirubrobacterales bacterium]
MGKRRMGLAVVGAAVSLSLVAAACGGGSDGGGTTGTTGGDLNGTITISGSSTVQPVSNLVAELFNQDVAPNVSISVDGPGTGDGFVLFCKGETDIQDASRAIEPEEAAACKKAGIDYVELEIALDGITVMTNPANSVSCLNLGDLYALFGPESQGFTSWSDANTLASEVGGTGNFPDAPLQITAPGEESGTYDAFITLAGIEDTALSRGVSEADAAALRKDYQPSPDDNVIISAMEGSPSALGFVGFAYAQNAGAQVKEIQVDGGSGCVAPTAQTIADASYPLSRSLYLYVNTAKLADNPAVKAFIDYYLTDNGLVASVTEAGYVQLPADRIDATRSTWNGVATPSG